MENNNNNPQRDDEVAVSTVEAEEELLIKIPSTIVHLIDNNPSINLAYGDLEITLLHQNTAAVAVLARVSNQLQWSLTTDEPVLKLDTSHYIFTLADTYGGVLNDGLTVLSKGQEELLLRLDGVLREFSGFREESVGLRDEAREVGPDEVERDEGRREGLVESSGAYWTMVGPNVEEYSSGITKMIAAGSGYLVKGIMWCGDVSVERLKWGEEFFRRRMGSKEDAQISPTTFQRIQRVKSMTMKSENIATGLLSGVIRVSQKITGSIVNSGPGKMFFNMLPGEIVLASFDAYNKVWDAVEAAGKNVMSTSSEVTTELVSERYGEEAARAANHGLDAAGHVIWTMFKIGKALNPKAAVSKAKKAS